MLTTVPYIITANVRFYIIHLMVEKEHNLCRECVCVCEGNEMMQMVIDHHMTSPPARRQLLTQLIV